MSMDYADIELRLNELKRTSRASLGMVILGAGLLIFSVIFSATRLAPLEAAVSEKSRELQELSRAVEALQETEAALQSKIVAAQKEYQALKDSIESLYAVRVTKGNEVYELKASARADNRQYSTGPAYHFSIFVNASPQLLAAIDHVTYTFDHPTFANKTRRVNDAAEQFQVSYFGWGCLTDVTATLTMKNGETQELHFNMCKSLGPSWWSRDDQRMRDSGEVTKLSPRMDCGVHARCPEGCRPGEVVERSAQAPTRHQCWKD